MASSSSEEQVANADVSVWDLPPHGLCAYLALHAPLNTVRLVNKNWWREVNAHVEHACLNWHILRQSDMSFSEAVAVMRAKFPRLGSLACKPKRKEEWMEGICRAFGATLHSLSLRTNIEFQRMECLPRMANLEHLFLGNSRVVVNDLVHLTSMTQLTRLEFYKCSIGEKGAGWVGCLHNLERLRFSASEIETLTCLKTLTNLVDLHISSEHKLAPESFLDIAELTTLTKLRIMEANFNNDSAHCLPCLAGLRHLDLTATAITNPALQRVTNLSNLRTLVVSHTAIDNGGLEILTSLNALECLKLSGTRVQTFGFNYLCHFRCLRSLELHNLRIGLAGLRTISQLEKLRELYLGAWAKVGDLAVLGNLKGMEVLEIQPGQYSSSEVLEHIACFSNLKSLSVSGSPVRDSMLVHLSRLRKLENLDLVGVGDGGVMWLTNLRSLTRLNLSNATLTDKGAKQLSVLKKLAELHISLSSVSWLCKSKLKRALPCCDIHIY